MTLQYYYIVTQSFLKRLTGLTLLIDSRGKAPKIMYLLIILVAEHDRAACKVQTILPTK